MKKVIFFEILIVNCLAIVNFSHAQTLEEATRLTDNEQYEAASDIFKALIAKEPNNAANYAYMGDNYLLADNPDSALIFYKRGEQTDPKNPLIKIGRAKYNLDKASVREMKKLSEIATEDAAKAKANYDKLVNKTPEDQLKVNEAQAHAKEAEAKYNEAVAAVNEANALITEALTNAGPKNAEALIEAADALVHYKNKDLDKAKSYLDKAAALQPKNSEILILYGDIYSELNNGTLSADYYNRALELNPRSAKSIVNKGRLYKRSTNYDGAAEEFKNAIKIEDAYAPAHRELGEVYFKLGKIDLAKQEYRRYLDLSKNNCSARIRYASFLFITKDYTGALNELEQQKNCDQNSITALRIKAYSSYEIKDSVKALAAIKNLFTQVHEGQLVVQDYEYYGKILSMNGQDSLAAGYLHKAFLLDNSKCDLLTDIWTIYDKLKNFAEAARVLEEKQQYCGNRGKGFNVTDYYRLGLSYFYNKDYQKADSAFAKVNELTPNYVSGWYSRARSNVFLDSTSAKGLAKPFYEKLIEVALADTAKLDLNKPKLIEAYRYLASYYYLQLHEKEKAKEYIKKALQLSPDDKDLQEIQKGFEFEQRPKKKP